jgi:FKBP-type peptidyl-prolyl cis-trans isomerase FkpA
MKKIIFAFVIILVALAPGCVKEPCKDVNISEETSAIMDYAIANGLTITQDVSGLFYQVIDPGSGAPPTNTSFIFVKYTGRYLNGNIFEQQLDHTLTGWPLNSLVPGWQYGIPLVAKGGKIRLVIPSSLAFGCEGRPDVIPSNTVLDFEIELVDFQ